MGVHVATVYTASLSCFFRVLMLIWGRRSSIKEGGKWQQELTGERNQLVISQEGTDGGLVVVVIKTNRRYRMEEDEKYQRLQFYTCSVQNCK